MRLSEQTDENRPAPPEDFASKPVGPGVPLEAAERAAVRARVAHIYQHRAGRRADGPEGDGGRWDHIFAALDMGTNNCRLLIARPRHKGFSVIDAYSRTVGLGQGIDSTGELQPAAVERALTALKTCVTKMERRKVTVARSIATEACRSARNGGDFLARIREETGLEFDVITPAEEARLAVMGCWPLVDRRCDTALVFDIGGGSTELIWVEIGGHGVKPRIAAWTSLPCGVMALTERFGTPHLEPAAFQPMVDEVRGHVESFAGADALRDRFGSPRVHLIGTSGTVTTLAGLHMGLARYDREKVDGTWLETSAVDALCRDLAAAPYAARVLRPCIGRERADYIMAGCAIVTAVRDRWPAPRLRVADRGLREGVLFSLMAHADRAARRRLTGRS